jgi:hypothetical protein
VWHRIRYEDVYILSGYTGFELVIIELLQYSSGVNEGIIGFDLN